MTHEEQEIPVVSVPFANADVFKDYEFYKSGITAEMTVPKVNGGKGFNRHMMNGLGYLATLGTCMTYWGYPFSKVDIEKAKEFGGYPKGAIVYVINEDGYVVEYESKVDNNEAAIPDLVDGMPVENDYWRPLYETQYHATAPDFSRKTKEVSRSVSFGGPEWNGTIELELDEPSWVEVMRTIGGWDELDRIDTIFGGPEVAVFADYGDAPGQDSVTIDTLPASLGATAKTSFPMGKGKVRVEVFANNPDEFGSIDVNIAAYHLSSPVGAEQ